MGKVLGLRSTQIIINQLVSGHNKLNAYQSWLDTTVTSNCESCGIRENTDHYLYHCTRFERQRQLMFYEADNVYETYGIPDKDRDTDIVTLAGMTENHKERINSALYLTLSRYIERTNRFSQSFSY